MAKKKTGWIQREGKLGGPGYTKKTVATRHRILARVVKEYGYRSALGSIMALERSTHISATVRKVLVADRNWLRETYGAASRKKPTAFAVPRVTKQDIIDVLRRAQFRLHKSGNTVSYTARGERGPRVTAPVPKTIAAARALVKRARPNYHEGRAGGGMEASFEAYGRAKSRKPAPRRVPSVARRTRKVKAAVSRMPGKSRPTTRRNGKIECGLHGIPMHGGSCVACLYEADIL